MSDFDKEAEREKLREKYEQEQQEREATQRMSDLLLKGATMTNTHCNVCGDPYFEMNGTTFCPTCHGGPDAVEGSAPEADAAEGSPDATADADPEQSTADAGSTPAESNADKSATNRAADAGQAADSSSTADASPRRESAARSDEDTTGTRPSQRASTGDVRTPPSQGGSSRRDAAHRQSDARGRGDATDRSASTPSPPAARGDLESARDSLRQALEYFAGEAAATDDPRYAKECLEAAREASETLNGLR